MLDIGLMHREEYELTGRSESVTIAEAPGRIHLLGEHGEPGAGLYLSAAIDRRMQVAVSARKDNSLRFYAADPMERKRTTLVNLKYKREDRWANYIKVAIYLFAEMGYPSTGFNFTIAGDIPQHVGLGSSSAIELASVAALKSFFRARISDRELLHRLIVTHDLFYGGNTADSVDYLLGLSARKDQFLLLDEASLEAEKIKSPFTRCKIILVDSRVPRFAVERELNARRDDIKAGLELLARDREGASLRQYVTAAADLMDHMGNLPERIRRRSTHMVQEIRRVDDAANCLRSGDIPGFSRNIYHSHESLRDLFEISCPETDWLVKRAQETEGVYGSRMTGQGFGGCTYALVKNDMVAEYKKRLEDYERIFGFRPVIHEVRLGSGCRVAAK